jgi:3-hydroxyanthranilate 3,4-dioxygenase
MPSIHKLQALSLQGWIEENKEKFKPPVGNAQIWPDGELMVTVVGGPNRRADYHDDPTEEFFYQLKGDIVVRTIVAGKPPVDIPVREGDTFLLPKHVRHSPQRGAGTIGLVIEVPRPEGAQDGFEWYCPKCFSLIHRAEVPLKSLVDDLPPIFQRFYGDEKLRTCGRCGHVHPVV